MCITKANGKMIKFLGTDAFTITKANSTIRVPGRMVTSMVGELFSTLMRSPFKVVSTTEILMKLARDGSIMRGTSIMTKEMEMEF